MSDDELETWQRQWRDDAAVPPALAARARADDARYRRFATAEYALSAVLLAASAAYAWWSPSAAATLLFIGIWSIGVPTVAFTVWNRRGLWRAADAGGGAFVALARQRCRRGLVAVRAGYVVLAAAVAFNLATFAGGFGAMPATESTNGVIATLVVAAAYLVALAVAHRRVRRRLAAYDALAREFDV